MGIIRGNTMANTCLPWISLSLVMFNAWGAITMSGFDSGWWIWIEALSIHIHPHDWNQAITPGIRHFSDTNWPNEWLFNTAFTFFSHLCLRWVFQSSWNSGLVINRNYTVYTSSSFWHFPLCAAGQTLMVQSVDLLPVINSPFRLIFPPLASPHHWWLLSVYNRLTHIVFFTDCQLSIILKCLPACHFSKTIQDAHTLVQVYYFLCVLQPERGTPLFPN